MEDELLIEYLKSKYSNATTKAYLKEIDRYLSRNPGAEDYNYQYILKYIGKLRKRYSNTGTLNRILSCIKAYYAYVASTGYRNDNPAKNIILKDKVARDIQSQDLFTEAELEKLLQRKERYRLHAVRNKVLIGLLIYQALLPKEIVALTVEDIDLDEGTVHIGAQLKTNGRVLELKPKQVIVMLQYLSKIRSQLLNGKQHDYFVLGGRGNVFTAEEITKHIKSTYRNMFEHRKVTPVSIRQSVITNLLSKNVGIRTVQVFAGHKNPSTTEQYKQSNVEALKEQVNLYHPIR
jgi:integrase/recombinase XerD